MGKKLEQKFIDYYAMLGIEHSATEEEIRQARKSFAKKCHPDANVNLDEAAKKVLEEKLKIINKGCEILLDPKARASYEVEYIKHIFNQSLQSSQRQQEYKRQQVQEVTRNYQAYQNKQNTSSHKSQEHITTDDEYYEHKSSRFNANQNNKEPKEKVKKNVVEKIINDYKDVRADEKKDPFSKRHERLDKNYHKSFTPEKPSAVKSIFFQFGRGTVHVSMELIHQILKLRYITDDSIPKYIIRNRILATTIAATIIAANVAGAQTDNSYSEDITAPISGTEIYGNDTYVGLEGETSPIATEFSTEEQTEVQEENLLVLNRIYTVEPGDTIAKLSAHSNTTINCIERTNSINGESIYVGQKLIIPYYIAEEEKPYYTSVQGCAPSTSLEDFAAVNQTDVATLIKLNEEAIVNVNDQYAILTDTLMVPTFITREELNIQRATTQTEAATQKNY